MTLQQDYSLTHRRMAGPGHPVDESPTNGRTRTAATGIQFGGAVQIDSLGRATPLVPGGVFAGIARAGRLTSCGVGAYDQYDNIPVQDAGRWWGQADKALAAGVGLNWNSSTLRWTDQAPGGAIVLTRGVEAAEAANGNGSQIPINIKRIRA